MASPGGLHGSGEATADPTEGVRHGSRGGERGSARTCESSSASSTTRAGKSSSRSSYRAEHDLIEVPAGSQTDFASVPRPFVWLLPTYGLYTPAAILHDRLWRHWVPEGRMTYVDADGVFRRAMRELGGAFLPPVDHVGGGPCAERSEARGFRAE